MNPERTRGRSRQEELYEMYRVVVLAMAEGAVFADKDDKIVAVNPAAEKITGRPSKQLVGHTFYEIAGHPIHEDGQPFPKEKCPCESTLHTGKPQRDVRVGMPKPDGTYLWISVNTEPIYEKGEEKPHAVVTTFHDVTPRKQIEDALRESEDRFDKAQEMARIGSWSMDLQTKKTTWSKELYHLFGADPKGPPLFSPKEQTKLFTPETLALRKKVIDRAIETGQSFDEEYQYYQPDGSLGWFRVQGAAVRDDRGRIVGLMGTAQEITERKTIEQEMQKTISELERLNLVMTGRELKMIELKKQIRALERLPEKKNKKKM